MNIKWSFIINLCFLAPLVKSEDRTVRALKNIQINNYFFPRYALNSSLSSSSEASLCGCVESKKAAKHNPDRVIYANKMGSDSRTAAKVRESKNIFHDELSRSGNFFPNILCSAMLFQLKFFFLSGSQPNKSFFTAHGAA